MMERWWEGGRGSLCEDGGEQEVSEGLEVPGEVVQERGDRVLVADALRGCEVPQVLVNVRGQLEREI